MLDRSVLAKFAWASLILYLSLMLGGCAYTKKITASKNRGRLKGLALGMTAEQVVEQMGTPWKEDQFLNGEQKIAVFYYITEHIPDGATTMSEATPLVLRDGVLVGWGNSALVKFQ